MIGALLFILICIRNTIAGHICFNSERVTNRITKGAFDLISDSTAHQMFNNDMLLELNDIIILTIINVHKALAAIQKYDVAVIVAVTFRWYKNLGSLTADPTGLL